jgi:hypothetical protein
MTLDFSILVIGTSCQETGRRGERQRVNLYGQHTPGEFGCINWGTLDFGLSEADGGVPLEKLGPEKDI